jgi:hypothetical protein
MHRCAVLDAWTDFTAHVMHFQRANLGDVPSEGHFVTSYSNDKGKPHHQGSTDILYC